MDTHTKLSNREVAVRAAGVAFVTVAVGCLTIAFVLIVQAFANAPSGIRAMAPPDSLHATFSNDGMLARTDQQPTGEKAKGPPPKKDKPQKKDWEKKDPEKKGPPPKKDKPQKKNKVNPAALNGSTPRPLEALPAPRLAEPD